MSKHWFAGAAVSAVLFGMASAQSIGVARADDLPPIRCEAADRIDGSTATDAQKKIGAAGYGHVTGLKKGCDNYWHGVALKDGVETHVSLSPQGLVQAEGD